MKYDGAQSEAMRKEDSTRQKKPALDLIASKESGGDYNVLVGGEQAPLDQLTVREVLALQRAMQNQPERYKSSALGKYQIKESTLMSLVHIPVGENEDGSVEYAKDSEGNLKLRNPTDLNLDTKFDAKAQEFAGEALYDRRIQAANQTAVDLGMPLEVAQSLELAKEWASLPDPRTDKSYYDGDGVNSSFHTTQEVYDVLNVQPARSSRPTS
jgi:hypothetical protein